MKRIISGMVLLLMITGISCNSKKTEETQEQTDQNNVGSGLTMEKEFCCTSEEGDSIFVFTLKNTTGMEMSVINYGGIITSLKVPDKNGNVEDVVLGFDSPEGYLQENPYFGALIGRFGNRIGDAKFTLNGKEYNLSKSDRTNHLHGGFEGFHERFWDVEMFEDTLGSGLRLTYLSPDGEEGYPGNLNTEVLYILDDESNTLRIEAYATTDMPTIVNITQHTYFNLNGDFNKDILGHELQLNASAFLPVSASLIPTGELKPVANTPFDFTTPQKIGSRIGEKDEQLGFGKGYDHCWVLDKSEEGALEVAAVVYCPENGRKLEILTDEPGIQFYSGNFLMGNIIGKDSIKYQFRTGFCLEHEHFPDAPNKPEFPSVVLNPGETFHNVAIWKFTVE